MSFYQIVCGAIVQLDHMFKIDKKCFTRLAEIVQLVPHPKAIFLVPVTIQILNFSCQKKGEFLWLGP